MPDYQSGFMDTFTCLQTGQDRANCIGFIMKITLTLTLMILSAILFLKQINKKYTIYHICRKQMISALIFIDLAFYLSYQWSYWSPLLYFPCYYFQYIYFCTVIYYFARKAILLGGLSTNQNTMMDINLPIQLKLAKLFCIGLIVFISLIFLINYINYFMQLSTNGYSLCSASFFNIVTTVGFLVQGLFVLQFKQLSRRVLRNIHLQPIHDKIMNTMQIIIIRRLKQLWALVTLCFIGSCISVIQNVYFVVRVSQDPTFNCSYFQMDNKVKLQNNLNSTIDFIQKFITFFLPYLMTIVIFWESQKSKTTDIEETDHNVMETIEIDVSKPQDTDTYLSR